MLSRSHKLVNGDRLSRSDFELLCDGQGIESAELINGVVVLPAAALRFRQHGSPRARMVGWLGAYASALPGVEVADNTSIRLDDDNEPQPDALMILPAAAGGRTCISADGFLEGVPELVVEIAASSVSIDANAKKELYARFGVPEYILWRVEDEAIDWFLLNRNCYQLHEATGGRTLESRIFSGLILDVPAMLAGRMQDVLQALEVGRRSHAFHELKQRLSMGTR